MEKRLIKTGEMTSLVETDEMKTKVIPLDKKALMAFQCEYELISETEKEDGTTVGVYQEKSKTKTTECESCGDIYDGQLIEIAKRFCCPSCVAFEIMQETIKISNENNYELRKIYQARALWMLHNLREELKR